MPSFIFGTTAKAIDTIVRAKDKPLRSLFFRPYESSEKALIRATSIVTDTPVLALSSAVMALICGLELLKAVGNLVTGHFQDSLENLKGFAIGLVFSAITAVMAVLSPFINTVDMVGGLVNTIRECCPKSEEPEFEHEYSQYAYN